MKKTYLVAIVLLACLTTWVGYRRSKPSLQTFKVEHAEMLEVVDDLKRTNILTSANWPALDEWIINNRTKLSSAKIFKISVKIRGTWSAIKDVAGEGAVLQYSGWNEAREREESLRRGSFKVSGAWQDVLIYEFRDEYPNEWLIQCIVER